ncbi:MAG TPA: hypothetical protein VNC78_12885 [Actinomycetota bacterium]|nr:hypothetical protein [Actinomycetota bacterium]
MEDAVGRWRLPFLIAATLTVIVCSAVIALPDTFVVHLARSRRLTDSQAGWAYGLLALAAAGQALYTGFVVLSERNAARRLERKIAGGDGDPRLAAARGVDADAATASILTLVYGGAALYLTGGRGGFWLFPLIAVIQLAWYYRTSGATARWLALQADPGSEGRPHDGAPYTPPLARGSGPS